MPNAMCEYERLVGSQRPRAWISFWGYGRFTALWRQAVVARDGRLLPPFDSRPTHVPRRNLSSRCDTNGISEDARKEV